MQWRRGVTVENKKGKWYLINGERHQKIEEENIPIIEAMEQGVSEDKEIVRYLARTQKQDEIVASFQLAQFMLDYIDYISEPPAQDYELIEP